MHTWYFITALGGLPVSASVFAGIAAWLAAAWCRRRALHWCLLFGAAMLAVVASKIAFIGWGIGVMSLDFAGFSGHAARAGAVFPVAGYLLCRRGGHGWRLAGAAAGGVLALLVAVSRVAIHTHSASEAAFGLLLGLAVAAAFIGLFRAQQGATLHPRLVLAALAVVLLQPGAVHFSSQQLMTGVALHLAGHDRPYSRSSWQPERRQYRPPCPASNVRFAYICT